jgi:hypothetical protein
MKAQVLEYNMSSGNYGVVPSFNTSIFNQHNAFLFQFAELKRMHSPRKIIVIQSPFSRVSDGNPVKSNNPNTLQIAAFRERKAMFLCRGARPDFKPGPIQTHMAHS